MVRDFTKTAWVVGDRVRVTFSLNGWQHTLPNASVIDDIQPEMVRVYHEGSGESYAFTPKDSFDLQPLRATIERLLSETAGV